MPKFHFPVEQEDPIIDILKVHLTSENNIKILFRSLKYLYILVIDSSFTILSENKLKLAKNDVTLHFLTNDLILSTGIAQKQKLDKTSCTLRTRVLDLSNISTGNAKIVAKENLTTELKNVFSEDAKLKLMKTYLNPVNSILYAEIEQKVKNQTSAQYVLVQVGKVDILEGRNVKIQPLSTEKSPSVLLNEKKHELVNIHFYKENVVLYKTFSLKKFQRKDFCNYSKHLTDSKADLETNLVYIRKHLRQPGDLKEDAEGEEKQEISTQRAHRLDVYKYGLRGILAPDTYADYTPTVLQVLNPHLEGLAALDMSRLMTLKTFLFNPLLSSNFINSDGRFVFSMWTDRKISLPSTQNSENDPIQEGFENIFHSQNPEFLEYTCSLDLEKVLVGSTEISVENLSREEVVSGKRNIHTHPGTIFHEYIEGMVYFKPNLKFRQRFSSRGDSENFVGILR